MTQEEKSKSEIVVTRVFGKSRLTSCKSFQPLKILNPSNDTSAHVVLSNFGGGLLAGDNIYLSVAARENARLFLTTQSNGRVFKSANGLFSKQYQYGTLEKDSLVVYFPDPVIPHAESRTKQFMEWKLKPDSLLLTIDWFTGGRTESGEQFRFTDFASEIKIFKEEVLIIHDNFEFSRTTSHPRSTAAFGNFNHFINGYLVGEESCEKFLLIKNFLLSNNPSGESARENSLTGGNNFIIVADPVKKGVLSFRAMGKRRLDLEPFIKSLSKTLSADILLGFDFKERKF